MAKEVEKLKAENVEGIVIDLRGNGGGSLTDVVDMVGLFIKDGPVVQVKGRDEKASVLSDRDKDVLYSGPLAVMVDELSASASEIFAAAIQDYHEELLSEVLPLMEKELCKEVFHWIHRRKMLCSAVLQKGLEILNLLSENFIELMVALLNCEA